MKQKKNALCRGFSLVEVLIAMAVFSVTALGLAALNKVSMNASTYGKEHTGAVNLAQYTMTWIQNEAAAFAPGDTMSASFPLLNTALANTNWHSLADSVSTFRFDEYLANSSQTKYSGPDMTDSAKFCVHYRVLPTNGINVDGSLGNSLPGNLYYASVLVTWPREGSYGSVSDWKDCTQRVTASDALGAVPAGIHSLQLNQIITRDFSNKI